MGQSTYTTLVYGIELSDEQAEQLDDYLLTLQDPDNKDDNIADIMFDNNLKDFTFAGDAADGCVHDTTGYVRGGYSDICGYYFGVDLGDEKSKHAKIIKAGATEKMQEKWKNALPILKAAKIKVKKPNFHFYTQTH